MLVTLCCLEYDSSPPPAAKRNVSLPRLRIWSQAQLFLNTLFAKSSCRYHLVDIAIAYTDLRPYDRRLPVDRRGKNAFEYRGYGLASCVLGRTSDFLVGDASRIPWGTYSNFKGRAGPEGIQYTCPRLPILLVRYVQCRTGHNDPSVRPQTGPISYI